MSYKKDLAKLQNLIEDMLDEGVWHSDIADWLCDGAALDAAGIKSQRAVEAVYEELVRWRVLKDKRKLVRVLNDFCKDGWALDGWVQEVEQAFNNGRGSFEIGGQYTRRGTPVVVDVASWIFE